MTRVRAAVRRRLDGRARDERGAIAIVTGVLAVILLIVAGFCVDIGNAWAIRGQLQKQVDTAAVNAANSALPVKLTGPNAASTQLTAAMNVAYWIACNEVHGQRDIDPSVPDSVDAPGGQVTCNGDTGQSSLTTYAQKMLTTGMVTFPTSTSISVTGPAARVDFGFGPGQSGKYVGEQKSATAQIYSPGSAAPIALGLQCTLSAAGTAPLGIGTLSTGAIPLNYIAAGPLTANSTSEPDFATQTQPQMAVGSGTLGPIAPTSQNQGVAGTVLTIAFNGAGAIASGQVRLHFYRGTAGTGATGSANAPANYTTASSLYASVLGSATAAAFVVPTAVTSTAGTWYVQAEYQPLGSSSFNKFTSKVNPPTYTVLPPAGVQSLTACANLMDSPRRDTSNTIVTGETLRRNIKSGMDHSLTSHPSLATLNPPSSVSAGSVLNTLNNSPSITDCTGSPNSVIDDDATRTAPLANCVNVATDGARQDEFTQGFLADPSGSFRGRLYCDTAATCSHGTPFAIPGLPGTYNNDTVAAYQNTGSILNSALFFGLSTYLTDNLPVVTPPSTALSPDLYSSPRFMWAAVASRAVGPTACTKCPVLTFRPIFLTQDVPSGIPTVNVLTTQLGNITGSLFNTILPSLFPFLDPAAPTTYHGILMDYGTTAAPTPAKLRALEFQTIEPTALPVPPANYNGPISDYLGTGPKVVRLVK